MYNESNKQIIKEELKRAKKEVGENKYKRERTHKHK